MAFSLEGSRIVVTPRGTRVHEDRRTQLKAAAAKVKGSFSAEFQQLDAAEIMKLVRGEEPRHAPAVVAIGNLAAYDGSSGVLVDTNVWVDCIEEACSWHDWASDPWQVCSERSPLHINTVIHSELLIPGTNVRLFDAMLDVYETLRTPLPGSCASLAASACALYGARGGARQKRLPGFFTGGHSAVSNLSVPTRDPKPCKSHFAGLEVITP